MKVTPPDASNLLSELSHFLAFDADDIARLDYITIRRLSLMCEELHYRFFYHDLTVRYSERIHSVDDFDYDIKCLPF